MRRVYISLGFIFAIFFLLLFYRLSLQEFTGDEASPMLLIDRMWDAFSLHDGRFLGYPFLFYHDPYRAIFSGTLLHFFAPNRILDRIPSILFASGTYWLFVWICIRERIQPSIIILSLFCYTISGLTINDRSAGGDAQVRFFMLGTIYFLWLARKQGKAHYFRLGLLSLSAGVLTMLDTVALLPGLSITFWQTRGVQTKKTYILIVCLLLGFLIYFALWYTLPILAFHAGFQHYLSNRGLFYYFTRTSEGVAQDPFLSFRALASYTSILFEIWVLGMFLLSFFVKSLRYLLIFTLPAWLVVIVLNRSSYHVIMYAPIFFLQAVLLTNYFFQRFARLRIPILSMLLIILLSNTLTFVSRYGDFFTVSPKSSLKNIPQKCLSEAVVRIYNRHGQSPLKEACLYPVI